MPRIDVDRSLAGAGVDLPLDRVGVDRSLEPVEIPAWIVNEMLTHARESLPHECCGLVFGFAAREYRTPVSCRNAMNLRHQEDPATFPRDAGSAYWMHEEDYLRACTEAEARGEQVTAVYHSHVGVALQDGAYLSELDLRYARHELFPFPGVDQIVIAVPDPAAEHLSVQIEDGCALGVGIFVWDAQRGRFRGHRARPISA